MTKARLLVPGLMVALGIGLLGSNCSPGPKSRCLIIVKEGGKAEVKSILMGGSASNAGWRSGNVVAFRETRSVPLSGGLSEVYGKMGEVYQIADQSRLQKIGEFDVKMSDSELLSKYGQDCG